MGGLPDEFTDLAGVSRPVDASGHDRDHVEPAPGVLLGDQVGLGLRVVVHGQVGSRVVVGLVAHLPPGVRVHRERGRVDDARDLRLPRGVEGVAGALHVDRPSLLRVVTAEVVPPGHVVDPVHPAERGDE